MWLVTGSKRKQGSEVFLCMYEIMGKVKESTPERGLESWVFRLGPDAGPTELPGNTKVSVGIYYYLNPKHFATT